ncbi:simple sugar transport system ATP-binding protein [Oceanotoga teriensis]|uniref:Simple sugar transport system ATP-binding protein n=1 Tax=Oceanotoga teriensis TaxID=515440 RepID=A0AA45C6T9_9BACT|nr:ABC transporter ATP-binding protein [Oceanotoga teriensis]PWJ93245.1 simple sugar transport system ATP-binding protein [Oceanotoga teriensis]
MEMIINTQKLTKQFGDFFANKDIDLEIYKGDFHALVGENGAGKTTLMNMLYGLYTPSFGKIFIKGKEINIKNPKDAIKHGIGMVHQHFKLVESLSIFENIFLGNEITKNKMFINFEKEKKLVQNLIDEYGYSFSADTKIKDLSVGEKQKVEILKILYQNAEILILDEPTAVLTPQEVIELLNNLKKLQKKGKTIIIITHKLNEVKDFSDNITVLRKGKIVGKAKTSEVSIEDIAKMMVGREVILKVDKVKSEIGENIYSIENVSLKNKTRSLLENINIQVKKGEIVGIAGVEGNGQTELLGILSGIIKCSNGKITFKNKEITCEDPRKIRNHKIGIIPEDRYVDGLCSDMPIYKNMIAGYHYSYSSPKLHIFNWNDIKKHCETLKEKFDIRTNSIEDNVSCLSGGNAQKIIIARELSQNPELLIVSQPTRGVDVGSIEFIHSEIMNCKKKGMGILLFSSELSEIMNLSDRIIVMYKGKIIGELNSKEATKEKIGLMMSGLSEEVNHNDEKNI